MESHKTEIRSGEFISVEPPDPTACRAMEIPAWNVLLQSNESLALMRYISELRTMLTGKVSVSTVPGSAPQ